MSAYSIVPFDRQDAPAGFNRHPILTFSDADDYCEEGTSQDPLARAREIFAEQGYKVPDKLIADGKIHRFSPSGERRDDAGAYVLHLDGWPCLLIWNHRLGSHDKFPLSDKKPDAAQQKKINEQIAAEKTRREEDEARKHAQAAANAERIWNEEATPARAEHPYLVKKGVKPHGLREHQGRLVVPMYRNDKLIGLEYISDDGRKLFLPGTRKQGAYCVIGDMIGDLCMCEGWATGASIYEATGKSCVVAFDAGNLQPGAKEFEGYPGGEITVCADDDWKRVNEQTGELENIGIIKAREAALSIGAKFAVPVFGDNRGEKDTDFNDMARLGGLDAVRECIAKAAYVRAQAEPKVSEESADATESAETDIGEDVGKKTPLPGGFDYANDGSIAQVVGHDKDGNPIWAKLCSPIEFLANTEDAEGKRGGILLRVLNDSGKWHKLAITRSDLVDFDDLLRLLMDHGLRITVGKDTCAFKRLLSWVKPEKRARCVERIGWHEGAFVLPDEVIGQPPDLEIAFQPASVINHAYRVGGTFEGWKKEIAARAVGNSRLQLALSTALAGTLLRLAPMEGGGIHFRGASSTGKTTALHCAGSVWGSGGAKGFIDTWRVTDNGLEGLALVRNDTLLLLDEMAQVDAKASAQIAYMLANGRGKARANRDGGARKIPEWLTMFISTGEISLAAKIAEGGMHSTAGQEVRVIDIPADAGKGMGILEELHGFASPDAFARALCDSAQRHYGHAARAFLSALTKNLSRHTEEVRGNIKAIRAQICPKGAASQVGRVADRFGLIAAAGELAIEVGIFPWATGDAHKAAQRCFNDWLGQRGGPEQKEDTDAIERVFGWLQRHTSRFREWEVPSATIFDCAGYVRDLIGEPRTFYVFADAFKNDICAKAGLDPAHTAKVLAKAGYLLKSADGKHTRTVRPRKGGSTRVYVIRTPEEEEEEETVSPGCGSKAA